MALGLPIGLIWDNVPSPTIQPCNDPNNIEDLIGWYDFTDNNSIHQNFCGTNTAVNNGVIARINNKAGGSDRLGMYCITGANWGQKRNSSANSTFDDSGTGFGYTSGGPCHVPTFGFAGSVQRPKYKTGGINGLNYGLWENDTVKAWSGTYYNGNDAAYGDRGGGYGNGVDMNSTPNVGFASNGVSDPNGNIFSNAVITTDDFSCFWVAQDDTADPSNTHYHWTLRKYSDAASVEDGYVYNQFTGMTAMTGGYEDKYSATVNSEDTGETDAVSLPVNGVDTNVNRYSFISGSGTNGVSFSKNGGTPATSTITTSSSFSMTRGVLSIGCHSLGNTGPGQHQKTFVGKIYEWMFFNRRLNAEEIACVENYLENKYT